MPMETKIKCGISVGKNKDFVKIKTCCTLMNPLMVLKLKG